jgi:hypothetical protein
VLAVGCLLLLALLVLLAVVVWLLALGIVRHVACGGDI